MNGDDPFKLISFGRHGFDPMQMRFGSEEERVAGYRGRGHETATQGVCRQHFESASRFEHYRRAFLTEKIEPPIGINRRSCEFAADPLGPNYLPCGRVDAGEKALCRRG